MAEEYPDIPLEHLAGLGSGPAPRPSDRDLLDYYLGPTGIPARLRSANQLLNPIAALEDLGAQSAAAANPDLSPEERRRAALAAALGTGLLSIPLARPLAKSLPAFRSIDDDAGRAVMETLTGASPDLAAPPPRLLLPEERIVDDVDFDPYDPDNIDFDPPDLPDPDDFIDFDADTAGGYIAFNPYAPENIDFDPYAGTVYEEWGAPITIDGVPVRDLSTEEMERLGLTFDPETGVVVPTVPGISWRDWAAGNGLPEPPEAFFDQAFFDAQPVPRQPELPQPPQQLIADQGPFFSTVQRAIEALPQDRYGNTGDVLRALERNGARPDEIRALGLDEIAFEGPITRSELSARVSERFGEGVGDVRVSDVPPKYRRYFPARLGANSLLRYNERVISLPRSAVPDADTYLSPHWEPEYGGTDEFPIMHYRTGTFSGPDDERYFHLGEIQSDYVQAARHQSGPLAEFARQNPGLLGDVDSLPYDRRRSAVRYQLEQAGLLPEGASATEVDQLWGRWRGLEEQLLRDGNLGMAPLPVAGTTDKFTQLGLRSALADAIADEADYFTIAPGASVRDATGGEEAGQLQYYDEIVPRNMVKVLKDLNRRSDVSIPTQLERVDAPPGVFADTEDEMVWGLRLTPEIRDAIRAAGMPVYRDGGLVGDPR